MKNIFKLGLLSILVISFNVNATVKELTLITLESGENLNPAEQIKSVQNDSIQLLDGRIINDSEIEYVEVKGTHGFSEIIEKGFFKILKTNAAKVSVGGDATGGG